MKIVTHDSSFHIDDIFAVATTLLKFPDAEVVRSRKEEDYASADMVIDTGLIYDPGTGRFDHHQPGGAGTRENGIQYASFGLMWKQFGEELAGGARQAELIDQKLVQPIDSHDNGMAITENKFGRIHEYTINDYLYSYVTRLNNTPDKLYGTFTQLVGIAEDLIKREVVQANEFVEGEVVVLNCYKTAVDKRIIELPSAEENLPWREVLGNLPEPVFVLYVRKDGNWGIKSVPDLDKPYGTQRKVLPKSWGGKAGEELQKVTGVPEALFAHRGLFMFSASTKEGALRLAEIALSA